MELKATRYEVSERLATITLHRPERMNAWTGRMHHEYRWCIDQADQDRDVGCIIVTGAGRGFCVGGDSKALEGHVDKGGYDPGTPEVMPEPGFATDPRFAASFAFHFGLSKPVIAAIFGPAAGVGLALACFADLRFAAAQVNMTTAHGKLNLPAEFGLSWLLPRMMGLTRANELLLSSRRFTSEEAVELGMVNRVVPADELISVTRAYALELMATVSPESLRQTRWQIYRDLHRDVADGVRDSEQLTDTMMRQPDFKEGVAALTGKRPPSWQGGEL